MTNFEKRLVPFLILAVSVFICACSPDVAFDVAICDQNITQVKSNLERGADPDGVFKEGPAKGFTPLTWALVPAPELCGRQGPNTDVAIAIIEHGADVNLGAETYGGSTPLMEAARTYDLKVLNLLLDRGADPNLTDDKGYTAAMVVGGLPESKEVLTTLVESGLDLTLVAPDGGTALSWAEQLGLQENIVFITEVLER